MGANSVTGVSGPGMSYGIYKPDLHCGGCQCGCKATKTCREEPEHEEVGCFVVERNGGGTVVERSGGQVRERGC